jgi:alpha-galactosidase/6-phospho-beta-glucosidase family protein
MSMTRSDNYEHMLARIEAIELRQDLVESVMLRIADALETLAGCVATIDTQWMGKVNVLRTDGWVEIPGVRKVPR